MRSRQFYGHHYRNKPVVRNPICGVEEFCAARRGTRQFPGAGPERRDFGHAVGRMFAAAATIIFSNPPR
jgi:hypothetical protein